MVSNLEKFVFLGVMILVTLFGSRHSPVINTPPASILSYQEGPQVAEVPRTLGEGSSISDLPRVKNPPFYRVAVSQPSKILSDAALLSDLKSGEIYFDLNSLKRWPIASLTKLMTAAVSSENLNPQAVITLTGADFAISPNHGNLLKVGDRYTVQDLMKIMIISSSNEAAEALAGFYGRVNFVSQMNSEARKWGMTQTYFNDPTGLSVSNQSTIRDIQKLVERIYENFPDIFPLTRNRTIPVKELNSGNYRLTSSTNNFSGRPDFLGGKTGYTDEANGNLVSLFSYASRPILVVVLGSPDRFLETEKLINWFKNDFTPSQ
ncbi:MAG: D-alanyl-D-alanine carboxypeptidase [Candidatus Liptonbacteria bacterium]|nr:D-alanyl-D-alanine carboxypeptidase [Candidatus Liptonbacteria bacterium]